MPSQHRHKLRQVRLPDALWDAFKADCQEKGETTTEAIRDMIGKRLGLTSKEVERMMSTHDGADVDAATGQARAYTKRR